MWGISGLTTVPKHFTTVQRTLINACWFLFKGDPVKLTNARKERGKDEKNASKGTSDDYQPLGNEAADFGAASWLSKTLHKTGRKQ